MVFVWELWLQLSLTDLNLYTPPLLPAQRSLSSSLGPSQEHPEKLSTCRESLSQHVVQLRGGAGVGSCSTVHWGFASR